MSPLPENGILAAKVAHEGDLFARANVVGVAVGHKVVGGQETEERCIVVFVEHKVAPTELRARDLVPRQFEGVRTDVVETGRFHALDLVAQRSISRTTRVRPAPGGVSIAHVRVTAGTLGVLARHADGAPVILSNNHVLANSNDAAKGDSILQPGPADGGTARDAIARLADFVPIRFLDQEPGLLGRVAEKTLSPILRRIGLGIRRLPTGDANLVDAAIAKPLQADLVTPEILGVGRVAGTTEATLDLRVTKSGRTTGLTHGRITALDAAVQVDYGGPTALFRQQIVSDVGSKGGDSGSLIVDDANRAVGLLFAGGATTTLMNPILSVLQALNLQL